MSRRQWMHLDRHRLALAEQWSSTFEDWDAVLCPAAPYTAFAHDTRPFGERTPPVDGSDSRYGKLPCWANLAAPTGLPVTTVPIVPMSKAFPSARNSSARTWKIARRSHWPIFSNKNWVAASGLRLSIARRLAQAEELPPSSANPRAGGALVNSPRARRAVTSACCGRAATSRR
jgi:hypothetical protein